MATADNTTLEPSLQVETAPAVQNLFGFAQTPGMRTVIVSVGAAITIALMVGIWLWSQQPDYKVLFSNFNDRDGGAIVALLQQQNIPYKYSEGGSAILVPANQVHDVRLRMAAQGLPKGGNVGFELMENQKLGTSQFLEQVNYHRALEGELARSIQTVSSVQTARVHLAIPKNQVFVRDQQKPSASVLLNLYPGRILDQQQVSAILHLVASSIPDMSIKNVTIVDQNGNLLSDPTKQNTNHGLDPSQIKYVQEYQESIVKRVESILAPVVGQSNVRAEATAEIDFSRSELAAETFRPNTPPEAASIRSQQSSEVNRAGNQASGVPGALTNQPPAPATAPITASGTATSASQAGTTPQQKDVTTNYELDKTIKYTQQPMGGLKRLTVAVLVNYKSETDKNGKVTQRPLTDTEKTQLTELVRDAIGYSKERGDSVNLVNSPFASKEKEVIEELPLWKQPDTIQMAKEYGRYAFAAALLAYLFFGYLRPMLYKMMGKDLDQMKKAKAEEEAQRKAEEEEAERKAEDREVQGEEGDDSVVEISDQAQQSMTKQALGYEITLEMAKELAKKDPRVVANVIKAWINNE